MRKDGWYCALYRTGSYITQTCPIPVRGAVTRIGKWVDKL